MFSFTEGIPIAKFEEGRHKGKKILRLISDYENDYENDKYYTLGNKIDLKNKIMFIPDFTKEREVIYIAGPSGAGKSTLVGKYLKDYKKVFPKRPIYIFSRKDHDPPIDAAKPIRIPINEELVENPIDITKEIKNGACIVFDDYATIQDDNIRKSISKLMRDILEIGRSLEIYCIITSHLVNPNERKDGRTIFNESHSIILFPKGGNRHAIDYCLKKYIGLDKKKISEIMEIKSRWVKIYKMYPNYVMHEHGAYIL